MGEKEINLLQSFYYNNVFQKKTCADVRKILHKLNEYKRNNAKSHMYSQMNIWGINEKRFNFHVPTFFLPHNENTKVFCLTDWLMDLAALVINDHQQWNKLNQNLKIKPELPYTNIRYWHFLHSKWNRYTIMTQSEGPCSWQRSALYGGRVSIEVGIAFYCISYILQLGIPFYITQEFRCSSISDFLKPLPFL
jgi:hypothetical protein